MRTCVILNRRAGSANGELDIQKLLAPLGPVELRETTEPRQAEIFARRAVDQGFECVIAAGGDGTVNEALNGIAPRFDRVVFGILPLGTGNDFARTLGIPLGDAPAAAQALSRAEIRPVDIVRVYHEAGRYFLNTAGAGFTAQVGEKTDSSAKEWWGSLAYIWGAAKTVAELTPYHLWLALDGEPFELDALTLVIANGRFIGGGIPIAPWARIDDGQVDVLILPVLPVTRLAVVVPQIISGQHEQCEDLILRRAASVQVRCTPDMPFNVDGEPVGVCPAEFTVLPRALRMLCA